MGFVTKSVLMVDIVDFSTKNNDNQIRDIQLLIDLMKQALQQALPDTHQSEESRIWSPAGDGGAVTFWNDNRAALDTAIALSRLANEHNRQAKPTPPFELRIGLHAGPVIREIDFDKRENIWGEGINIAARVASLAKRNQIVASKEYIEQADLHRTTHFEPREKAPLSAGSERRRVPRPEVASIGKWWAKHNRSLELYNIYVEGAGIPASEVDVWYGPFHYPLERAIEVYDGMLMEQLVSRELGFRVAVLAKRLLDLDPRHRRAKEALEAISARSLNKPREMEYLHDKFLSPLTPSALNYFFAKATFKSFRKGDVIVQEGVLADSMMMVVSGEVGLSIRLKGKPLHDDLASQEQANERALTFSEGAIIGEMGLFSPGGRRTATVTALRNTIMLTLDYSFLHLTGPVSAQITLVPPLRNIVEIRNRIWEYYCERIIQNQLASHPLFQRLPSSERNLLAAEIGDFLPKDYGQPVELTEEEAWRYWVLIVSGRVTVYHAKTEQAMVYNPGDCLGPIHLMVTERPFKRVETTPDTQVIRFKWSRIREEILPHAPEFRADCLVSGDADRSRYFALD
jgi:class 3 adenylate cyclase